MYNRISTSYLSKLIVLMLVLVLVLGVMPFSSFADEEFLPSAESEDYEKLYETNSTEEIVPEENTAQLSEKTIQEETGEVILETESEEAVYGDEPESRPIVVAGVIDGLVGQLLKGPMDLEIRVPSHEGDKEEIFIKSVLNLKNNTLKIKFKDDGFAENKAIIIKLSKTDLLKTAINLFKNKDKQNVLAKTYVKAFINQFLNDNPELKSKLSVGKLRAFANSLGYDADDLANIRFKFDLLYGILLPRGGKLVIYPKDGFDYKGANFGDTSTANEFDKSLINHDVQGINQLEMRVYTHFTDEITEQLLVLRVDAVNDTLKFATAEHNFDLDKGIELDKEDAGMLVDIALTLYGQAGKEQNSKDFIKLLINKVSEKLKIEIEPLLRDAFDDLGYTFSEAMSIEVKTEMEPIQDASEVSVVNLYLNSKKEAPDVCSLTFIMDKGEDNPGKIIKKVKRGKFLKDIPDIQREGYEFKGWRAQGIDEIFDFEKNSIIENMTLTPVWSKIKTGQYLNFLIAKKINGVTDKDASLYFVYNKDNSKINVSKGTEPSKEQQEKLKKELFESILSKWGNDSNIVTFLKDDYLKNSLADLLKEETKFSVAVKEFLASLGYGESEYQNIDFDIVTEYTEIDSPITKTHTLNIDVKPKRLNVRFNADNETEDEVKTVEYGSYLNAPANPEKAGCTFLGWFKEKTDEEFKFGSDAGEEYKITKDLTLVAKWKDSFVKQYLNINIFNKFESEDKANKLARIEYAKYRVDDSALSYKHFNQETGNFDDVTLLNEEKNNITERLCNLSFDIMPKGEEKTKELLNNYKKGYFGKLLNYDTYLSKLIEKVIADLGYELEEYQNIDFYVKVTRADDTEDIKYDLDITLKPRKFIVIFNSEGGTEVPSQGVEYNSLVKKVKDPTKANHTFKGWFDGDTRWNFEVDKVIKDVTLKAVWQEIKDEGGSTGGDNTGGNTGGSIGGDSSTGTDSTTGGNDTTTIDDDKTPLGANPEQFIAYLNGYEDGTIRPSVKLTREAAAAILFRLLEPAYRDTVRTTENKFIDVNDNNWSNKHISTLAKAGIIKGYGDNTFAPKKTLTRAELATMVANFFKLEMTDEISFKDVKGHWAAKYIAAISKKGWVEGYEDGAFLPDKEITRAEFARIINKALNRNVKKAEIPAGVKIFSDLSQSKWYYEDIITASNSYTAERNEDGTQKWLELIKITVEM